MVETIRLFVRNCGNSPLPKNISPYTLNVGVKKRRGGISNMPTCVFIDDRIMCRIGTSAQRRLSVIRT